MIISVDVFTKDLEAALEIYRKAILEGATSVRMNSSEDWDTKEFEHINLMFDIEHSSDIMRLLDLGPFSKDYDDL